MENGGSQYDVTVFNLFRFELPWHDLLLWGSTIILEQIEAAFSKLSLRT